MHVEVRRDVGEVDSPLLEHEAVKGGCFRRTCGMAVLHGLISTNLGVILVIELDDVFLQGLRNNELVGHILGCRGNGRVPAAKAVHVLGVFGRNGKVGSSHRHRGFLALVKVLRIADNLVVLVNKLDQEHVGCSKLVAQIEHLVCIHIVPIDIVIANLSIHGHRQNASSSLKVLPALD